MNGYIDNRLRSDKATTFLGFIDDLRKLWDAAGKSGEIKRRGPKSDNESFPIITYRVIQRTPHPSFKEIKPRLRGTIQHPERPKELIELYGQVYQVFVEFKVYSTSDEEADELAVELEEFLILYQGFFKNQGVKEILFSEQGPDDLYSKFHVPLSVRSLIFDMQFEKVIPKFLNQINQVAVQANIHDEI